MVEPAELSQIVTCYGSGLGIFRLEQLHKFIDVLEVIQLKALDIFLPEVFAVARAPLQGICVDFFDIFFEAGQDSVVLFKHVLKGVQIFPQILVLDVFSRFIFNNLNFRTQKLNLPF